MVVALQEGTIVEVVAKDLTSNLTPALEHLLFEIGSVTKTFVATALADLVTHGGLGLDDRIGKFLPQEVGGPREITLRALASHTSGLSREPWPMWLWGGRDALRRRHPTTVAELYAALAEAKLSRPGKYHYSNFGYMLLGHLVSLAASEPLPTYVRERIFLPLEMASTAFADDLDGRAVAQGYRADSGEVVPVAIQLPGAGGMWSTARDLTRWTAAWLQPPPHLERAMALARTPAYRSSVRPRSVGLAWRIDDDGLVWHTGGTAGFTSFCSFHPTHESSLVVLMNAGLGALDAHPRSVPVVVRFLGVRRAIRNLARSGP